MVAGMRVADFFAPEDHEIHQREKIRAGSQRLIHAIRTHHPERYVPAPPPVIKARPAFVVPPLPRGYVLPPLPTKGAEILRMVAEAMETGPEAILSENRTSRAVECRALVATTLKARGWSYPQIGRLLHRDHSSIINACDKIGIYRKRSPDCDTVYKALAAERRGK
jgi:hypothetical protein